MNILNWIKSYHPGPVCKAVVLFVVLIGLALVFWVLSLEHNTRNTSLFWVNVILILAAIACLLAAAPVIMDAEYLLDIENAGSNEWLDKWDTKLEHILGLKDDEGYHLYVLCGEEDLHFDYEEYLEYNREKKSELCMLRLVNDPALKDEDKKRLALYLNDHTIGCVSEAALRVLLDRHGDEREYYRLMLDIGVINDSNLEAVLNMMGDRHAQMKAYLMEHCVTAKPDYFDELML